MITLIVSFPSAAYQPAPPVCPNPKHHLANGAGPGAPPMLVPVHFVQPPPAQVPSFTNQPQAAFTTQPQAAFTTQPQGAFTNQPQAGFTNQPQGAPIMSYGPQPMQFQPMQPIVSLPPVSKLQGFIYLTYLN